MKKFRKKIYKLLLPVAAVLLIFLILIAVFESNNYFGLNKYKQDEYMKYNISLPKLKQFNRSDTNNIIIGDSRITGAVYIGEKYGDEYFNLAFGGANIYDNIDIFWYAANVRDLEKVVFQISYYQLDGNGLTDRKTEDYGVQKLFNDNMFWKVFLFNYNTESSRTAAILGQVVNPVFYVTSNETIVDTVDNIRDYINSISIKEEEQTVEVSTSSKDTKTREEKLEDYSQLIKKKGKDYTINRFALDCLIDIAQYCDENDIELVFVTPPMHTTIFDNAIEPLQLYDEMEFYKSEIIQYATLYDMEFKSEFSTREDYKKDGFHFSKDSFIEFMDVIFIPEYENENVKKYYH